MPLSTQDPDFCDFIAFLRLKNLASGSIAGYQLALEDLFRYSPPELSSFKEVTPQHLRAYVASLQAKGRASKTVADRVTILKWFFGYLQGEGYLSSDPAQRLPMPRVGKRLPKALTPKKPKRSWRPSREIPKQAAGIGC